jgi:hypothetical protein
MDKRCDVIKLLVVGFLIVFLSSLVVAGDIAYIYKNIRKIDQNVIDVFNELGHDVDLVQEKEMGDLSSYGIIYVGDERFRKKKEIPVGDLPTIVSNYHHGRVWGITDRDGVSKMASNARLKVNKNEEVVEVYTMARDRRSIGLPYYYIADLNKVNNPNKVVGVYTGSLSYDFGDVIAYFGQGSSLFNGETTNNNICFFGIVASKFWTAAARDMFKDCVGFVSDGIVPDNGGDEPPMNETKIHDVGFVNFNNAVNNIRIEKNNGEDILGNEFQCNEKYKIGITIMNNGDFVEDVNFTGSINGLDFLHNPIENFDIGDKKLKTKTVNFSLEEGEHTIKIEALIGDDANLNDNMAERDILIVCNDSNEDLETDGIHDVGFVDFSNSVGMIRLEHSNGTDILESEVLQCNLKYKVVVNIENKGNFSENVSFEGSVGNLSFNHIPINNFEPGVTKLKTKTVNFSSDIGEFFETIKNYTIRVEAMINGFDDLNIEDNFVDRDVNVFCEEYDYILDESILISKVPVNVEFIIVEGD